MNSNAIELLAVSSLKSQITRCELLRPEISENDKTPSFDGHIELYNAPNNKKDNLMGRCPVQVKGKTFEDDDFKRKKISYPVEVADLKNYLKDGGVIYFVVGISETSDHSQIYYRSLLPLDIKNIISSLSDSQKTKNISLEKFPNSTEQIEKIFRDFLFHKNLQFGKIDLGNEMQLWQAKDIENCTIWINPTPTLFDALLDDKPKYLYRSLTNTFHIPLYVGTIKEIAIKHNSIKVSIDDKVYFHNAIICFQKSGKIKSVTLNQGLSIRVNSDNKNATVKFTEKCTIPRYIENLEFMIALAKGKELKIGNLAVGSNPKTEEDIDLLTQRLEIFKKIRTLLERLHITKNIKVREITESMYRKLDFL